MNKEPKLKIELNVNGKEIEMNEFVQKIIGNLLYAAVKSLRLDEQPETAVFRLEIEQ
jgi:hypothetical protein